MDIISVLVCTRNRSESLGRTVRSLLASDAESFELIIIDQSDEAVGGSGLPGDARIRHVPSRARGKGAALNEGLALARGAIIVCTDDDCEAQNDWVRGMAATLEAQPSAAVLFCNVVAPPCDWSRGYIPTYIRTESRLVQSMFQTCTGHGMGAGMAVRRDVVRELGGFDEEVGPGARFPSGDDWDIEHRALLRGWHVYESAELAIVHHGFRTLEHGRAHVHRDWFAIGGVCGKPIRAGYLTAAAVPAWYFLVHAFWPPLNDLAHLRRPRGWSRITGFLDGFAQGLTTRVRRPSLLFEPRPATAFANEGKPKSPRVMEN